MDISPTGEALSRLIQVHARRAGLNLKWTGKTVTDIELLCCDCSNKTLLSQCLWNGMKELWDMAELHKLSEDPKFEPVFVKICSIILKAQANFDLNLEKRNLRAQKLASPTVPSDTPGGLA